MQKEDSWPQDQGNLLLTWWPHFGTAYLATQLDRPRPQVKR
jgi:hypothetical protein